MNGTTLKFLKTAISIRHMNACNRRYQVNVDTANFTQSRVEHEREPHAGLAKLSGYLAVCHFKIVGRQPVISPGIGVRELAVNMVAREDKGLLGPIQRRTFGPSFRLHIGNALYQFCRDLPRLRTERKNKHGIPIMMKVPRPHPRSGDTFGVATTIIVVGSMQGLMQIADQMEQEFERDDPLLGVSRRTCKLGCEFVDFIQDAIIRWTVESRSPAGQRRVIEACLIDIGVTDPDVDIMPLARSLA